MKPNPKLIEETKRLIRLQIFFMCDVGLKRGFSRRELKEVIKLIKKNEKILDKTYFLGYTFL